MIFISTPKRKITLRRLYNKVHQSRLDCLKNRMRWKKRETDLKADTYKNSHSLLWVWEFSKKAVLICFIFYVIVQVYSMIVMVKHCDFSYLGELISQTGEIVQNCVFAYLIKAGLENVGKIWFSHIKSDDEDPVG